MSWKTADFGIGDVLIFTSRTIHMSSKNVSDRLRISCDTRYVEILDSSVIMLDMQSCEFREYFLK